MGLGVSVYPTCRPSVASAMTGYDVALRTVHEFFKAAGSAGLVLPNGWFGRPYDNQLRLTHSEADRQSLVLVLDGHLVLTLVGPLRVYQSGDGLRLTGFTWARWDTTTDGGTVASPQEFASGEIAFIAPPI